MTKRIIMVLFAVLAFCLPSLAQNHGVQNLTATDETLSYLETIKEFEGVDDGYLRTRIWFDPYNGNDANTGTYDSPYYSIEKMKAVCTSYTRCSVKGKDAVFGMLSVSVTATTQALGEQFFRIGEAVSWTLPTGSGNIVGFDPNSQTLVIHRTSAVGTDVATSSVITASNPTRTVTAQGVFNSINGSAGSTVDNAIVPKCHDRDRICILIDSEFPDHPAVIQANNFGTLGTTTADDCGLFSVGGNGSGGWLGVQNIIVNNIATDAFSACSSGTGKLITLRTGATTIRNGTESRVSSNDTNSCYSADGGIVVAVNSLRSTSRADDASGIDGACLHAASGGKLTVIGGGPFTSESVAAQPVPTLYAAASDVAVVSADIIHSSTGGAPATSIGTTTSTKARLQLARALTHMRTAGTDAAHIQVRTSTGGGAVEVRASEHSAVGTGTGLELGSSTNAVTVVGRALGWDNINRWIATFDATNSVTSATLDLQGYYDDDDAGGSDANEWVITPTSYATRLAFVAAASAINPNWSQSRIFGINSKDSGGASVNGTLWSTDTVHYRCAEVCECWRARIDDDPYLTDISSIYSITDYDDACPPQELIGERFCRVLMQPIHIGAR